MADMRLDKLDPPVDLDHDHVLGPADAELTLVEYGSYSYGPCHAVHEVIEELQTGSANGCVMCFVISPWLAARTLSAPRSLPSTPQKPPEVSGKFMRH
jgi:hypothetical protein